MVLNGHQIFLQFSNVKLDEINPCEQNKTPNDKYNKKILTQRRKII